jgi:diguanylate cyclase (GGDEF)-like protein
MANDNEETPGSTGMEDFNARFKPQNRITRSEQKTPTQEQIRDGLRATKVHGDVGVELDMLTRGSKSKAEVQDALANAQLKLLKRFDKMKSQLDRLKDIAYLDPLTGLLNRRSYDEYMEANSGKKKGILFIDADNFKQVNNYGYDVGDEGLKIIANAMLDSRNGNPILFRIGGDEFVAIYEDAYDPATLKINAEETRENVGSTELETTSNRIMTSCLGIISAE